MPAYLVKSQSFIFELFLGQQVNGRWFGRSGGNVLERHPHELFLCSNAEISLAPPTSGKFLEMIFSWMSVSLERKKRSVSRLTYTMTGAV